LSVFCFSFVKVSSMFWIKTHKASIRSIQCLKILSFSHQTEEWFSHCVALSTLCHYQKVTFPQHQCIHMKGTLSSFYEFWLMSLEIEVINYREEKRRRNFSFDVNCDSFSSSSSSIFHKKCYTWIMNWMMYDLTIRKLYFCG
jgi:hypothetical protein